MTTEFTTRVMDGILQYFLHKRHLRHSTRQWHEFLRLKRPLWHSFWLFVKNGWGSCQCNITQTLPMTYITSFVRTKRRTWRHIIFLQDTYHVFYNQQVTMMMMQGRLIRHSLWNCLPQNTCQAAKTCIIPKYYQFFMYMCYSSNFLRLILE
jgi:hypothetical protein